MNNMNVDNINIQQRILCLNNQGVQFIREGNLDDAIPILAEALSAIKQRTVNEAQEHSNEEEDQDEEMKEVHGDDDEDEDYIISEWFTHLLMAMPVSTKKKKTNFGPSTPSPCGSYCYGYVHQSPIELPMDGKDDIAAMLNVQLVIVMFNLAMAFHLNGLDAIAMSMPSASSSSSAEAATSTKAILQNAVNFYELCYAMMGSEQLNVGLYFLMCLANNLGQCHAMLNCQEKSNKCFEHLLSMQMYLMDTTDDRPTTNTTSTSNTTTIDDDDDNVMSSSLSYILEGFFQNTSYLILSDTCASAA